MITINKAQKDDVSQIMEIKADALALFKTLNDPQWNEEYPALADFLSDIDKGELFVAKDGDKVLGFAVISENAHDDEYAPLAFSSLKESLTFCRFAVRESERGKGVAKLLFNYALECAKQMGKRFIITDTHESNVVMQKFLKKNAFYEVDNLSFPNTDGKFIAFEKSL